MRRTLQSVFDNIYILDLHGNTKKKEKSPDGSKDENVFDIQQGVAIGIFVKDPSTSTPATVRQANLWGLRKRKYGTLRKADVSTTEWAEIAPHEPFYLFAPQNTETLAEYERGWSISDVMGRNGRPAPGVVTTHDQFAVSWTAEEAAEKVHKLLKTETENEARRLFRLCRQSQWAYRRAKRELIDGSWHDEICPILYRPFDVRWTIYNRNVAVHRRERVMNHMLAGQNLALITSRMTKGEIFKHAQVTRNIAEVICMSPKTSNNGFVFPLYLYTTAEDAASTLFANQETVRVPNLSSQFTAILEAKVGSQFVVDGSGDLFRTFGPEDVLYYIYAVFHSPTYRTRYAEFLKIDFPRLPLTSDRELFAWLVGLGVDLVALHLLEDDYAAASWNQNSEECPLQQPITTFVEGVNGTTMGAFSKRTCYEDGRVYLDTSQRARSSYFEGVPEEVWNFHIGGYQVCRKWLYDRRGKRGQPGRTLTEEGIAHYHRIVVALKETMRLMEEIDEVIEAYGGWPIE